MSRSLGLSTTPRLYSTAGTWGAAQIVATPRNVVLDLETRNYDVAGVLHRDHALANLPIETARRLRDLLDEAIEASLDASAAHQANLWSESTMRAVAGQGRARRAG